MANIAEDMINILDNIRDLNEMHCIMTAFKQESALPMTAQPLISRSCIDPHETNLTNLIGTNKVRVAIRQLDSVRAFVNITRDTNCKKRRWE